VLYRLLLGSVAAKVLYETQCPVWTAGHMEAAPPEAFSICRVLCSVDLTPHNRHTLTRAAEMAAAVDAELTLVHVTSSVESFGPGGSRINAEWKKTIVGIVTKEIAGLQQAVGTKAEVIIHSGNVPQLLNRAAEQTKADVLVIGHIPGRSHLGDNGERYGITALAKSFRCGRAAAASPLGEHGYQRPRRVRRSLCEGARRT
jgi:nucleotide-binding universal stress UspA family protein